MNVKKLLEFTLVNKNCVFYASPTQRVFSQVLRVPECLSIVLYDVIQRYNFTTIVRCLR